MKVIKDILFAKRGGTVFIARDEKTCPLTFLNRINAGIDIHNYIRIALWIRCMYTKRLLDRLRLNGGGRGRLYVKSTEERLSPRARARAITECCAYICSGLVFTMPILIDHIKAA